MIRTATHQQKKQLVSLSYKDPLDIVEAVVELERNDVDEIEDSSVIATTTSSILREEGEDAASGSYAQKELQYTGNMSLPNLTTEDGFVLYPYLFIPEKTNPVQALAIEPVSPTTVTQTIESPEKIISTAFSPPTTATEQLTKNSLFIRQSSIRQRLLLQPLTTLRQWLSNSRKLLSKSRRYNPNSSVGTSWTSQHYKRSRRKRQHRDSRISRVIPSILQRIKHNIQCHLEGQTVYVLSLSNNKYYVGSTSNRKRRYKQHATNRGAKYTRIHGPIQGIYAEYRHVPYKYILGYESYITAQLMLQFGINNVRGGMFCGIQNFDMTNVDILTYYIGHYCNLDYTHVYNSICHELLQSTTTSSLEASKNNAKNNANYDDGGILSSSAVSTMSSASSSFATRSSRKRFRSNHESPLTSSSSSPSSTKKKKRKKEHGSSSRSSSSRSSSNNNKSGGTTNTNNNARCYICGEIGHTAASCSMRHVASL